MLLHANNNTFKMQKHNYFSRKICSYKINLILLSPINLDTTTQRTTMKDPFEMVRS